MCISPHRHPKPSRGGTVCWLLHICVCFWWWFPSGVKKNPHPSPSTTLIGDRDWSAPTKLTANDLFPPFSAVGEMLMLTYLRCQSPIPQGPSSFPIARFLMMLDYVAPRENAHKNDREKHLKLHCKRANTHFSHVPFLRIVVSFFIHACMLAPIFGPNLAAALFSLSAAAFDTALADSITRLLFVPLLPCRRHRKCPFHHILPLLLPFSPTFFHFLSPEYSINVLPPFLLPSFFQCHCLVGRPCPPYVPDH